MARTHATTTAMRLITLIMLLQRKPNQQAADLATALGVSIRTLHRYINMLDEMGIPIYSERGPYGGFSLVRGYKMAPIVFTPEEAVVVSLGTSLVGELWGPLYREAANGAAAKLDNVLPNEQRQEVAWAKRALVVTGTHRTPEEAVTATLITLRHAIRTEHVILLHYQGREGNVTDRQVEPYALVQRWGWWYLVGYCRLRQAVRSFRVDRIRTLTELAESFVLPATFDIQRYLATEPTEATQQRVQLRFGPEGAAAAWENRYQWETITEDIDGGLLVTLVTPDLLWAASTVLAYSGLAVAVAPPELCDLVCERAQAIAQQHQTIATDGGE